MVRENTIILIDTIVSNGFLVDNNGKYEEEYRIL